MVKTKIRSVLKGFSDIKPFDDTKLMLVIIKLSKKYETACVKTFYYSQSFNLFIDYFLIRAY